MNLQINSTILSRYKSPLQIVRVISEDWAKENLYCVSCTSNHLSETNINVPVFDFICEQCGLKSIKK